MTLPQTFASLSIPNYRRYFFGALSGNTGQWMSATAKSWLVLVELTDSNATVLGWLTAAMFVPNLFVTPFGGLLADRLPKRNIAIVTQSAMCLSAITLSVLVISGQIRLWHVFALALFDGVVGCFDNPARQAFVSELVGHDRLSNAIGLNSASFNAARLIGPGVAGFVIAVVGTGYAFAVNALGFLVLIFMLTRLRSADLFILPPRDANRGRGVSEGLRYVIRRPDLTLLFVIGLMMGTFAFNYGITNTLMATEVFDRGPGQYGMLGSIMGVGSLTGALLIARRARPRIRHIFVYLIVFCLSATASALAPDFWIFCALMVPIGFSAVSIMVTANSMVQISIAPEVRGRVMALWGLVIIGLTPAVSPLLGWAGDVWGARTTILVATAPIVLTVLGVSWYLFINQGLRLYWSRDHHIGVRYRVTEDVQHR
ncbi:MAG: MFS transporter [Propionibacteriaceae bacterium]|jgi:MFS family permease|nr:MFS transporter [Propionibacteriaceae bacterium]